MRNHIIFFSGGKSSFSVAHLVKERYPNDNILLYFTDTLWEDEDLYRFIYEASNKLQLPMLYHCLGLNPVQLMHKQAVVFNSRIGDCSKILKMGVAADYLKNKYVEPPIVKWHNEEFLNESINPAEENFKERTTLYFGIGFEEMHREGAIKKNWQPFTVEMPLIDEIVDNDEVLAIYNIRQPRLYDLGFAHNNCMGRVKAGQGHYINLLQQLPELFQATMAYEHHMSRYVSEYHYLKNQKYVPEHEQFDDDTLQILLDQLNDAYEDYFWNRATKPKVYIPSYATATPYETNLLLIDYVLIRNKKGIYKREAGRKSYYAALEKLGNKQPKKKWFIKSQDGLKLIETRHCKPRDYSYIKRTKKGIAKPYPLRNLYWDAVKEGLHQKPKNVIVQKQKSTQLDLFDVGGCGCDFSQTDASACDLMAMLNRKELTA